MNGIATIPEENDESLKIQNQLDDDIEIRAALGMDNTVTQQLPPVEAKKATEDAEEEEENDTVADLVTQTENVPKIERRMSYIVSGIRQGLVDHDEQYRTELDRKKTEKYQALTNVTKAPHSHVTNTAKEERVLEYVENFRQQYSRLFPSRKELLLMPENEFGVKKFVCTTIKPTRLAFKELYDYRTCAEFISHYVNYEQLDPVYDLPSKIPSPSFTLQYQHGNSFDMAILLVSLLRGAGYDAYVVSGYAKKRITTMDATRTTMDVTAVLKTYEENTNLINFDLRKEVEKRENPLVEKYKMKSVKKLQSLFVEKQKEKKVALDKEKEEKKKHEIQLLQQLNDTDDDDELAGLRVHAWVLILPGPRDIAEPFFIDPPSGKFFGCRDPNFVGVESVFSSKNYWVNMQPCYDGLNDISFDLADTSKWEFVLLNATHPSKASLEEDEDEAGIIEIPNSWVQNLTLTRELYESKCPLGYKATVYKNAKHEIFSDYHRPDGMVARITIFPKRDVEGKIYELFKNRKDKLKKRVKVPHKRMITEYFDHGKPFHLKEHIMIDDVTRELIFYDVARHDGLCSRHYKDNKIVEVFCDREDHLVHRKIVFSQKDNEMRDIVKVSEKFTQDPSKPAQDCVSKRTFFVPEEKIRVIFYLEEGFIFPSFREYKRPNLDIKTNNILQIIDMFQGNVAVKPISKRQLQEELFQLLDAEQNLWQEIKKMDREVRDILKMRTDEESDIQLAVSLLDTIRNEEVDQEQEERDKEQKKEDEEIKVADLDYLSPFLVNHDPAHLTKDQIHNIKEMCLKSVKDRLIEKANIIQSRLDELNAEYQKRQLVYSKNSDTMSVQETDEHMRFCNETLFKIHILEKRLAKHKETAPARYLETENKLKADPRLKVA